MHYLLIIPAPEQATANEWMKKFIDPEGGEFTFTNGLNLTGEKSEAPEKFWAAMQLTPEQVLEVRAFLDKIFGSIEPYDLKQQPDRPQLKLNEMSFKRCGEKSELKVEKLYEASNDPSETQRDGSRDGTTIDRLGKNAADSIS
jgi:hypothetical protein